MRVATAVFVFLTLAALVPGHAQVRQRDPLNEKESDELREVAQEPDKRLKLLVKFTRARMAAIDQLRSDSKVAAGRGQQLHDLLQDFTALIDELDNNVDDYSGRRWDMRKGLKDLIEAETEFQSKLKALKETGPGTEQQHYSFVLQNAIEAVDASVANARQALQEQEEMFKKSKKDTKK